MARKPRIEPIASRNFQIVVSRDIKAMIDGNLCIPPRQWYARNLETCADTEFWDDFEAYYRLKRIWRRSKEKFDSACRQMDFIDLFSQKIK